MNDDVKQYLIGLAGRWPHVLLHTGARDHESAEWLLQHVLTMADDKYLGLDTDGIDESRRVLSKWGTKVTLIGNQPSRVLRHRLRGDLLYDESVTIAYLDGTRSEQRVSSTAKYLWPIVRSGGIVIWDHYRTPKVYTLEVCVPVDAFLETHEHEVLSCGQTMIVSKV